MSTSRWRFTATATIVVVGGATLAAVAYVAQRVVLRRWRRRQVFDVARRHQFDDDRCGGDAIGRALAACGVRSLFYLCGGHVSPVAAGVERAGIRVVDVRHEANAVHAADATARLTGVGVALVTAGPGVSNCVTALVTARMAYSPLVLLGGTTAQILRGRGSLQDVDQVSMLRSVVKRCFRVCRAADCGAVIMAAVAEAQAGDDGVPGPVFVELPTDVIYSRETVDTWAEGMAPRGGSLFAKVVRGYLRYHSNRVFRHWSPREVFAPLPPPVFARASRRVVERAAAKLRAARRIVVVVSSGAMLRPASDDVAALAVALQRLAVPTFLSGTARGLLSQPSSSSVGAASAAAAAASVSVTVTTPTQLRHGRTRALRDSDCVLLLGAVLDFRMSYGTVIARSATIIACHRHRQELYLNRTPTIAVCADVCDFTCRLVTALERQTSVLPSGDRSPLLPSIDPQWLPRLLEAEAAREREIAAKAGERHAGNECAALALCTALERSMGPRDVLVVDGGDIVGTASYVVRPRAPLRWLDPGAYGCLGVGAGFALAAAIVYGDKEAAVPAVEQTRVWLLYGDGACGYSVVEFDTYVRHGVAVIAVVGNDACWSQIERDQKRLVGSSVGCMLLPTRYDTVVEGLGGGGTLVRGPAHDDGGRAAIEQALRHALSVARRVQPPPLPTLVNVIIDRSDFREGSLSV